MLNQVLDWLFGRPVYDGPRDVARWSNAVSLPEGVYAVTCTVQEDTFQRPRWPFPRRAWQVRVEPDVPIPAPGHLVPDTTMYMAALPSGSAVDAAGRMVAAILARREKYGGPGWVPAGGWPPAQDGFTPRAD